MTEFPFHAQEARKYFLFSIFYFTLFSFLHNTKMSKRKHTESNRTQPLVVMEMGCSYAELYWMVERIQSKDLPPEIIHNIASFFTVEAVDSSQIQVVGASSSSGQHPLCEALNESQSSWWISRPGSMPHGRGREYLELQLLSKGICRLQQFSIQIPPLPMGPLSVRRLRLEQKHSDNQWVPFSPIWTVENKTGWQNFTLDPPVDVQFVRVLCLSNQMALVLEQIENSDADVDVFLDGQGNHHFWSVGFYCVKFS